jgi:hypothetical protein
MYEYIFIYIVLPLIIIIKIIDFFCRKHFFHVHLNILDKVVSSLFVRQFWDTCICDKPKVKFWRDVGFKLILGISFFCQHNSTGGGFLILKQIIVTLNVNIFLM